MKIVVIQEEIIQTDITPKELTERWKRLEQLPGIDEVVIEGPAHNPNIEQLHTYIGDADAVFGLWIGPDNMNEAFLSQHPNLKYVWNVLPCTVLRELQKLFVFHFCCIFWQ